MAKLSKAQELFLELMREGSFNDFDGKKCARVLLEYKILWKSCILTRTEFLPLVILRDLQIDYNADTLYIFPSGKNDDELYCAISALLNPDEIGWINEDIGCGGKILRAWWD
jgi:hypothetical protein